jgi:hypothetical protein
MTYWWCAKKGCMALRVNHNSTSLLMGENLPVHDHTTNLLKRKAKEEGMNVIKKHGTLPGTSNKVMANKIVQNFLSLSHPNPLLSMSTTNGLTLALYREKKKLEPLPPLPMTYQEVMKTVIPASLTNTADGSEFLILNSWINNMELRPCGLHVQGWVLT